MAMLDLVRNASAPGIMGFVPGAAGHELTARADVRVLGDKHVRIPCSNDER